MKLEFVNLSKSYGSKRALIDVSATLEHGVYALLGPNGAGKTTMMNILVDNLRADSGAIFYDGKDTREMGVEFRQLIGFMPQQQQMYQSMTAERFLFYIASLKGLSKNDAKLQIDELFERVNLSDSKKKKIAALSGGMKQRLLIAQALLGNPPILVLDEPTAGLDPKERVRMRNLVESVSDKKIIIYATHVVSDVETIARNVLFLKNGELIGMGAQSELAAVLCEHYDIPQNPGLEDIYMALFENE